MATAAQHEWRISVGAEETSALLQRATTQPPVATFVCAHGAGGNLRDRGMDALAGLYTSIGLDVVRFNFLYREKKSSRPDPMPRLKECIVAVVDRVREELHPERLVIGGRSMGGRAASMLAAES